MGQAKIRGTFEERQAAAFALREVGVREAAALKLRAAKLEAERVNHLSEEQRHAEVEARERLYANRAAVAGAILGHINTVRRISGDAVAAAMVMALADTNTRRENVRRGLTPEGKVSE